MNVNEKYRLKKMAMLTSGNKVADIGYAQMPNPFLQGKVVLGIDPEAEVENEIYTHVFRGTLETFIRQSPSEKFDTVIAGELLEHLDNPMQFLRECFNLLNEGGRLILSTPNPNSFIERLLTFTLNRKFFYTKDHLMLFPQRWLIRMLEDVGFKHVKLYSGGFPIPFLGLIPFPRVWCYQTIAVANKKS